jgi:hypothetical protein
MTTITLTDVTIHSSYASRLDGWVDIELSNGDIMTAYCAHSTDNWTQSTKRICHADQESDQTSLPVDKLLLQTAGNGKYIIFNAEFPPATTTMTYARPAYEHVYLELPHKNQDVLSIEFLAIVAIIFSSLYGLKWLFEAYVLPR